MSTHFEKSFQEQVDRRNELCAHACWDRNQNNGVLDILTYDNSPGLYYAQNIWRKSKMYTINHKLWYRKGKCLPFSLDAVQNWFFVTPSFATKFQYINSLLISFFTHYMFRPLRAILRRDIQLVIWRTIFLIQRIRCTYAIWYRDVICRHRYFNL
jgi:hypothetical protein